MYIHHTPFTNHTTCPTCIKKFPLNKPTVKCFVCMQVYHAKCGNLTPDDIGLLKSVNGPDYWLCHNCNLNIFPFHNSDITASKYTAEHSQISQKTENRITCCTCSKLGNKLNMSMCQLCDRLSHNRCVAGSLGCKACLKDIYPGYEIDSNELFILNGLNDALFNPYLANLDINYIGTPNIDDDYESLGWSKCSELLNECKYYEPCEITKSRDYELKVFSLNIRSLNDKIGYLRDNISHYSKFDILSFNESNCDPLSLPFGGKELILENFHAPIMQAPSRSSNRGGGNLH